MCLQEQGLMIYNKGVTLFVLFKFGVAKGGFAMSYEIGWSTCKNEHLSKLKELLLHATERPTVQVVNQQIPNGEFPFANSLSSDFGSFEAAIDYAERELKQEGWTPPWQKKAVAKPILRYSVNATASSGAKDPIPGKSIGTISLMRLQEVHPERSKEGQQIMDYLVKMVKRDQAIPTVEKIKEEASFSTGDMIYYIARHRGMAGVYYELKMELKKNGIDPNQFEWPKFGKGEDELKRVKDLKLTTEELTYVELLIDACEKVKGTAVLILPTWRQVKKDPCINSNALVDTLGKKGGWSTVIRILKIELERRKIAYVDSEDGERKVKPKAIKGKNPVESPQAEAKTEVETEAAKQLTEQVDDSDTILPQQSQIDDANADSPQPVATYEDEAATQYQQPELPAEAFCQQELKEPKKRGRKPQAFDREEEIAKLCRYKEMLGGKDPTLARLQKLAHQYPGEITAGRTLEKRLGPCKEWPGLIAEYLKTH